MPHTRCRLRCLICGGLLLALAALQQARADDLASLQGVWASEDFPWTMEVRESTATFRGVNPLAYSNPPLDEPLPEFQLRFTLDATKSPKQFHVHAEDFARFRNLLHLSDRKSQQEYAQPKPGIYEITSGPGELPARMKLEFYPHDRRWTTKGFNDQAFAYLSYVPSRNLRRLSPEELAIYGQASGLWSVELKRDDKVVYQGKGCLFPGWFIFATHEHGRLPLHIDPQTGRFRMRQTAYRESAPIAVPPGNLLSPSRLVSIDWIGELHLPIEQARLELKLRAPQQKEPAFGSTGEFVTLDRPDLAAEITEMLQRAVASVGHATVLKGWIAGNIRVSGVTESATAILTRIEQPAGEDPLVGFTRISNPEWPTTAQLAGTWKLSRVSRWNPKAAGTSNHPGQYEALELKDPEIWTFKPGKLSITSATDARNQTYVTEHRFKHGIL